MRLPADWEADKASGWWSLHHLTHTPCGWRSGMAYDLITNESDVRRVVYGHTCDGDED
ncbi:hypothetical protein [Streptomyces sp. NRRL S-455]|uniref:hypothetical protein n=1 Tax=Streptomyces sp. NRRL S-455 TaxID=1463908 RepID=UPI000AD37C8A|nr:hypothetical protein [Streptomyces sp. NRRL S-455]